MGAGYTDFISCTSHIHFVLQKTNYSSNRLQITEMNKRWQEYNQQRDTILNQLQKELADFKDKDKLHEAKTANLERAMQEQLHRILEDAQRNVLRANQERDQVIL